MIHIWQPSLHTLVSHNLLRWREMWVVARSAADQFKRAAKGAAEIGSMVEASEGAEEEHLQRRIVVVGDSRKEVMLDLVIDPA